MTWLPEYRNAELREVVALPASWATACSTTGSPSAFSKVSKSVLHTLYRSSVDYLLFLRPSILSKWRGFRGLVVLAHQGTAHEAARVRALGEGLGRVRVVVPAVRGAARPGDRQALPAGSAWNSDPGLADPG